MTRLKYPHRAATRIYRSAPVLRLFRPRSGAARRNIPVPARGRDIVSSPPTGLLPGRARGAASRFAATRVTPPATDTSEQMGRADAT